MRKCRFLKQGSRVFLAVIFLILSYQISTAQETFTIPNNTSKDNDQIIQNRTINGTNYRHELWMGSNNTDHTIGTGTMTIGPGEGFSGTWTNDSYNYLARRGLGFNQDTEHQNLGDFYIVFDVDYNPGCQEGGNSYLAVYGWTVDPLVEYYIIENWCNWNPSMADNSSLIDLGFHLVEGDGYHMYALPRHGPTILGGPDRDFMQYFSVRTNKHTNGSIPVTEHFDIWEAAGRDLGKFHEVSFVVEGYQSGGSFSFNKLEVNKYTPHGSFVYPEYVRYVPYMNPQVYYMNVGETLQLDAEIVPTNASDQRMFWEVYDANIVTVSQTGLVTAHNEGQGFVVVHKYDMMKRQGAAIFVGPRTSPMRQFTMRALGTKGDEEVNVLLNGIPVATHILTTNYQTYTNQIAGNGEISVEFVNDDGLENGRDVRLDYIMIDGERRETESMANNGAVYQNGSCGGSYSEWLNCNGAVSYGQIATQHTITIRARGNQGGEHMDLLINGQPVNSGWWLGTTYQEYSATVTDDGDINVEFDNDGDQRDLVVDWLRVDNQNPRQAENMQYNTGAYANGRCGGGSYTQWLHCNGVIGFGMISANFKSASPIESDNDKELSSLNIFPNPSTGEIIVDLGNVNLGACVKVLDYTGKLVFIKNNINDNQLQISNLKTGMYIVTVTSNDIVHSEKLIVE